MFQKLTPLFILSIFIVGAYFMVQGMQNATHMTKTQKEIKE